MELPPCTARQPIPGDPGWYHCGHPQVAAEGDVVHDGICWICRYLPRQPAPVREARLLQTVRRGPCRHLGEQIGERGCATCGGGVRLKVFLCRDPRHGETTLGECRTCRDYEWVGEA